MADPIKIPSLTKLEQATANALAGTSPFGGAQPVPNAAPIYAGSPPVGGGRVAATPIPIAQPSISKPSPPMTDTKRKPGRPVKTPPVSPPPKDDATSQVDKPFKNPIVAGRTEAGMPTYRTEFEGRDIFVGLPWYKTSNPVTSFALVALALDFGRDSIRFDLSMGDAMVYHSRNKIAAKFLESDARYLFMMDDDIIPSIGRPGWMRSWVPSTRAIADNVLNRHVLHRLVGSGNTLIGGAYFGRQEGANLMCSNQALAQRARNYEDSVQPVDWVATGCMLVHRKVFEDIRASHPELAPETPDGLFDYFHPINANKGEDVSFCERARIAGHQPFIDLGLPSFHVGYKTY